MYKRTIIEGWNQLFTTGMAIDGEMAWFANNIFNGLYTINLRSQEIKFVTTIPNEKIRTPFLYSNCYIWKDSVVIIPANADHLAVYNKKTQKISQFKLEDDKGEIVHGFFSSWQKKNYIYLISIRKPVIARFNVDSQAIDIYSHWDKTIRTKDYTYSKLFWGEILVEGDLIYIPCMEMNYICVVDLRRNSTKMIEIDTDSAGIYTICKCKEKYYISTSAGTVFEVDYNGQEVVSKQVGSVTGVFCRSIVIGADIYFFPKSARNIYKYSTIRKQMEPCLTENLFIEDNWKIVAKNFNYYNESYFQMIEKMDDNKWIFMLSDGCLYLLSNGNISKKGQMLCKPDENPLCVLDEECVEVYKEFCDQGNVLRNSLYAFLQILENRMGEYKIQDQTVNGEKIYESIINWRI